MKFYENQYYHIYNRTNNQEALFKSFENYLYFLTKYRFYLDSHLDTIAYCLMPTHFHFLVKTKSMQDVGHLGGVGHLKINIVDISDADYFSNSISSGFKTLQSSYTKAINKQFNRNGSLFQQRFKVNLIEDENYFINSVFYIHQNPVRSNLVKKAEEWTFSSYQDYIDLRKGNLP
jgi:putative transposase